MSSTITVMSQSDSGTESEFSALVARAGTGDQTALATLVQNYEPEVRMTARVLLGPALRPYLDSVDLVQSVHRSMLKGLRSLRFAIHDPEQLLALALTIVRRKVARHWRKMRRQKRSELVQNSPIGSDVNSTPFGGITSPQIDPIAMINFDEQWRRVQQLLDPTERQLVEMRLLGHSTAEVARTMGLDPDVLRVRLHRLRNRLRASGLVENWL